MSAFSAVVEKGQGRDLPAQGNKFLAVKQEETFVNRKCAFSEG